MTKMNDRENAFENKFAHDEKMNFKIEARGVKLFGLWIAEKLGLSGDAATSYAGEVVAANMDEPGLDDVLRKVRADLAAKNVTVTDHALETELQKKLATAKEQINTES
jgi:hypothetical protein